MTRDAQTIAKELQEIERKKRDLQDEQTKLYWASERLKRQAKKSTLTAGSWVNGIGQIITTGDLCVGVTANRGAKVTVGTFAGFRERGGKVTSVSLNIMKEVYYYQTTDGKLHKRYPLVDGRRNYSISYSRIKKQEIRRQSFTQMRVYKIQPTQTD
jgi:hypothetical protein